MTQAAEKLLTEALRLSPTERVELAHRLLKSAADSPSGDVRLGRARWETLGAARGIVHLGGDAVADCERLYDS
jgi:hypothetical protein